ncbi:MAG: archaemetzincin family Zn-dependent metalloprotease [Deltaproteobacteria bacterium]|nr:archaemetzincin family Zn-dependent metalloprotease [Deltaproteobacteria bacterium]MBW2138459.1 archaemetzincin family Zn-dependent metalloprotease [Deltaproteobacteria bacterium]
MNPPREHTILVTCFDDLDPSLLHQVRREIGKRFGCRTEAGNLLQDVEFALDRARDQYHSTLILEKVAELAPLHVSKVLAIVNVDLFIPILTHVYGEAQLGGKTAIISTFRLDEGLPVLSNPKSFYRRVVKEAIHELGHTFNLRHCPDHTCIMHYCRTVRDMDRKSDQLCRYCRILLADEMKKPP